MTDQSAVERAEIWRRAAALFDQLATADRQARDSVLSSSDIAPEVRAWLDRLLAAHDREQTALIDRQMTELVRRMLPGAKITHDAEAFYRRRFGPWQALQEIGRGGMGLVLEGRRADGQFDKRVAIKLLDPAVVGPTLERQLNHELRILASLSHPAIAQLLDGGVNEDGLPYLVIEYVDGVPIHRYCEENGLELTRRLDLFLHVADAVSYCHRRLVVHGDIKPDNVLVSRDGQVKLLDFGIASRLAESADADESSRIQRWCSPAYAAPERLRGAPPAVAEDVYALAALLYELLTGGRIRSAPEMTRLVTDDAPVAAPPAASAQADRQGRPRTIVQSLQGDLDAIFQRALAPQAAQRYADVEALSKDLQRWRNHYPVRARSGGALYPAGKWLRRNRLLAVSAGLMALVLTLGAGVALWQSRLATRAAEQAELNAAHALSAQTAAEAALRRADATNRFLLELFEAEIPGLPPNEMPSTRQLLDQGIARARDAQTGPPKLRAELMLTLANILRLRYQIDEADALLDEATAILTRSGIQEPDVRIQAGLLRSDLARARNHLDDAQAALIQTRELLQQHRPDSLLRLEVQRDLARIEMRRENWSEAQRQLEAVLAQAETRADAQAFRLRVAGDLASVAGRLGDYRQALARFEQVLRLKRALPDSTPLSLATTQVNIAGLHMSLGHLDRAQDAYHEVLELLAPFPDLPQQTRATALKGLADVHRKRGEFEPATDFLTRSAEQWRQALNLATVEDDFFLHYYRGQLLADQRRWADAIAALERALMLMQSGQEAPPHRIAEKQADIARFYCHLGQPDQAVAWLDQAAQVIERRSSLAMAQAESRCALAGVGTGPDPERMPMAMIEKSAATPGDAIQTAELELLRAELLRHQDRDAHAAELIDSARARLKALGVDPQHPLVLQIEQFSRTIARPDAA